jgi:hypothetical protein
VGDDGALAVVPAARFDARKAPHGGLGAVRAHHAAGPEPAPVAELDPDRIAGRLQRREIGAQEHDAQRLGARGEGGLDAAVLADVPEVGLAQLRGVEHQRAGPGRIHALLPDDHPLVSRGAGGDGGPGAGSLEELLRGARESGHAQVERRTGRRHRRRPRLDERDAQSPRGGRRRE